MILWTRIRLTFWSPEETEMKEEEEKETLTTMAVDMEARNTIKDMAMTKEEMIFPTTTITAMVMIKVSITTMPMVGTETATPTVRGMLK
ncbi:hypothetical protein BGZ96_004642, partial [Linnemannia gamsii]